MEDNLIKITEELTELLVNRIKRLPVSQPDSEEAQRYTQLQKELEKAIKLLEQR